MDNRYFLLNIVLYQHDHIDKPIEIHFLQSIMIMINNNINNIWFKNKIKVFSTCVCMKYCLSEIILYSIKYLTIAK